MMVNRTIIQILQNNLSYLLFFLVVPNLDRESLSKGFKVEMGPFQK